MATISSGEQYFITAGQSDNGDVVEAGGELYDIGGADTNTDIEVGGHAFVLNGGAANDATVSGLQCVEDDGLATGATVYAGGTQEVFDDGLATATVLNGGAQNVYSAGSATNVTISNGGFEFVQNSGSIASGVTISNGSQYVFSGGVAYNTTVDDGYAYVSAGGSAVSATFNSGADDNVFSGGVAIDTTLIGGYEYVASGGVISGTTTISSGGQLELDDAVTSGGEIEFDGKAFKGYSNVLAGTVKIDGDTMPTATISGFSLGDEIDLSNVSCSPAISCSLTDDGVALAGVGQLNLSVTDALNGGLDTIPVIGLNPDDSGGTDVETAPLMALLALAFDTYTYTSGPPVTGDYGPDSYQIIASMTDKGFEAIAYELNLGSGDPSVVVAFRGTQTGAGLQTMIKNLLADVSFTEGRPNAILKEYASDAAKFLQSVVQSTQSLHPLITLTGHSLGGALAQLVGKASNFATAAFDAPGAGQLYGQLAKQLAPAVGLGYGGTNVDYSISGDQVSMAGSPIGQPYTIASPYGITANSPLGDVIANFMNSHGVGSGGWQQAFANIQSAITPGLTGPNYVGLAQAAQQSSLATKLNFNFDVLANVAIALDPVSGTGFTFTADAGSPDFNSIELPFEPGVADYEFSYETGATWSAQQTLQPGVALALPSGTDGVQFDPVDGSGNPVAIGDGFALTATFATSGTFSGTLTVSGALPVAQPITTPALLSVGENASATAMGVALPTDAAFTSADDDLAAMVTGLPSNGTVYLSDGTTPVTIGEVLTPDQLTGLTFEPTFGATSQNSVLTYQVTDPDLSSSNGVAFVTASSNKVVTATVSAQPYFASEQIVANGVFESTDYLFAAAPGQPYSAYEYDYSAGGAFIGSKFYYASVPNGVNYAGEEIDYNGAGALARAAFTGVSGAPYSSYEYEYVGGVFAGSKFDYTTVPAGASYSSFEVDYNQANAFAGEKFFFASVTGQSYSDEEMDFGANLQLSRILLTGVADQAYSSLELDYSGATYEGYKAFYTGLTGSYKAEEVDVSASGQLEKVIYSGVKGTPYSSVEQDYANGLLTDATYGYTDVSGQTYYAYQVTEDASGSPLQEAFDLDNGGHNLTALASGQTLTSLGNDKMTGDGATTFVLDAVYGADTITNLTSADTVSLPDAEFINFAAVTGAATQSGANVVIAASDGDTLTLKNMTTSTLTGMQSNFTFHT